MSTVDINSRIAAQNQIASQGIGVPNTSTVAGSTPAKSNEFAKTLAAASAKQGITFSGHAQTRLASRQINLTEGDLTKLSGALDRAAAKGARSSLVLMDSEQTGKVGLVVSVQNRTVITAVDTQALKENIFTNIDSAMLL
ncbi:MAG TPA: TIGR02530 family flagellar biosynthesis protein [Capsulimonadaceae bacterium]|jgi:flagellar operon protein